MTTNDADQPEGEDPTNEEGRIPDKIEAPEAAIVVIKFTGDDNLLELHGDDVDLGTDLKVRFEHQLIAEFRRDAVDGWWFKPSVLNETAPFGPAGG